MLTINALQTPDAYGVHTTCWDREATVPRAYPGAPTSRLCPSVVAPSDRAGQEVPASVWTAAPGRRRVGGAPCQDRRRPTAPHSPSPEPRSQHWYFRMTGPRWPTRTCDHTHTVPSAGKGSQFVWLQVPHLRRPRRAQPPGGAAWQGHLPAARAAGVRPSPGHSPSSPAALMSTLS